MGDHKTKEVFIAAKENGGPSQIGGQASNSEMDQKHTQ